MNIVSGVIEGTREKIRDYSDDKPIRLVAYSGGWAIVIEHAIRLFVL